MVKKPSQSWPKANREVERANSRAVNKKRGTQYSRLKTRRIVHAFVGGFSVIAIADAAMQAIPAGVNAHHHA